jgi:hypothetical protein
MISLAEIRNRLLNQLKNPYFKLTIILVILGIGGVAAATTININSGTPISLGAGYTVATSCDEAITVRALPGFSNSLKVFTVETITVSGVNELTCGNKEMEMMTSLDGTAVFTSWSIASSSNTNGIYYFTSATSTVNSAYANTALSPRAVTSFNNFALTFKSVTSTAPSNVTLTVSDGSGDSTQPITANVALRFTAPSAGTVANISMAFKSKPEGSPTPTLTGGTGSVTSTSAGIVNLALTPTISGGGLYAGPFVYTVTATFPGFPAQTQTVDITFTAIINSPS